MAEQTVKQEASAADEDFEEFARAIDADFPRAVNLWMCKLFRTEAHEQCLAMFSEHFLGAKTWDMGTLRALAAIFADEETCIVQYHMVCEKIHAALD